ncbi:hypothetical protein GGI35DRAFT_471396 [Trichoderma velutinum]
MENHLTSLPRYRITELPTNMPLKDNVFRGVDGFLAKYFENQGWSTAVQNTIHDAKSADIVNKLSADIFNIVHLYTLMDWLVNFRSLFFTAKPNIHFSCESISTPESCFSASIYLETGDISTAAGSARVYGEYHHGDALLSRGDDDFIRFAERALQVFKAQPTRHFLHAFTIRGTLLELWVFDRAGAYSSELVDLAQSPQPLLRILAGYGRMNDQESGINTFVKCLGPGSHSHLIGHGTTCLAASKSTTAEPNIVVKFSWRADNTTDEPQLLQLARERNVWGGLHFSRPFSLGRPIRTFESTHELLDALGDLVKAIRSLYVDGRMLHRDIAIKNLVIIPRGWGYAARGILIDFDAALDLDNARAVEPLVGSDGFMAIGILFGQPHTYRHDLESLFYVFLWLAIANDREHDHAHEILEGLPETSRLRRWCSMDFRAVGQAKAADMSLEGFEGILSEFSGQFVPLKGLAKKLHGLIFPVRDGVIFTGTDMEQEAVHRLCLEMANAFMQSPCCAGHFH